MKISRHFNFTLILVLLVAACLGPSQGSARAGYEHQAGAALLAPLGTAFTYQGQLKQDGQPVEGSCDFRFVLWNADIGGSQVGSILDIPGLTVSNGFFTASLDFGSGAFDGQARWLEVNVRCPAGSGSYTSLGRQPLTPTPYALYSQSASQADLLDGQHGSFYQDLTNLTAGTLGSDRFSAYSDLSAEGYLANAAGDLAQNNGALQSTLNADLLDGQDSGYYQRRVSGSCTVGSAIRSINVDGTVECEPFAIFGHSTPDPMANVGLYTGITIGGDGLGLISYYDAYNLDLKVAHCNDRMCSSATVTVVESDDDVGQYTSITTGSDGFGLIGYYDFTDGFLKVAHCTNAACSSFTTTTVETVEGDGRGSIGITIGSDGFGLISYYAYTSRDLKVAHCTNVACTTFGIYTLDGAANDVGGSSDITIGNDGLGLISYSDGTNGNLKVAHCTNIACSSVAIVTVDGSADVVGLHTSITIGEDGLGLISYYDVTNSALKVAHCTNMACSTAADILTLDSVDDVGQDASITTGSDGFGLISYYDATNAQLKVVHCHNAACSSRSVHVLDNDGSVGRYTSIAIGSDGLGIISYFDSTNADLKVTHCDDVLCVP